MKKVLVTGASGLLGSKILQLFKSEYDITGTFNHNKFELPEIETVHLDITDPQQTSEILNHLAPDLVIHSAAERNVDYCEQRHETAWKINVEGTRNVINGCKKTDAHLIFISTDMVFSNNTGRPFLETDEVSPLNYYGECKVEAEKMVAEYERSATVRVSMLYGWHLLNLRSDFVGWVIDNVKNKKKIGLFTDQYRNITFIDQVALGIKELFKQDKRGTFHIAGNKCINRFEFGKMICRVFELKNEFLESTTSDRMNWIARRPNRCCMDVSKAELELGIEIRDVETNLNMMKNKRLGAGNGE
jgi:dTDP-4-dehydrorhamnose reductase